MDSNSKYLIIGRDNCSYCAKAKALLNTKGLDYDFIYCDEGHKALMAAMSLRTLPQVFTPDGVWIGGFDSLEDYLSSQAQIKNLEENIWE